VHVRKCSYLDGNETVLFTIPEGATSIGQTYFFLYFPRGGNSTVQDYQYLIKEPHGCTEQVASTCYLMAIAIQQIQQAPTSSERFKALQQCETFLRSGFSKLKEKEGAKGGFDWWYTADTGNIAVTAFVVNVLSEMKKVYPGVEDSYIQSIVDWMMTQRDGTGRLLMSRSISSYARSSNVIIEAYVLWVLTSVGKKYEELKEELDFLFRYPKVDDDPYVLALIVLVYNNIGRKEDAMALAKRLANEQASEGFIKNPRSSITNSYGSSLICEVTSLATIAWMLTDLQGFNNNVNRARKYLESNRGTGSTQSAALYAKVKQTYFELTMETPKESPYEPFQLIVNGKTLVNMETESNYYTSFNQGQWRLPLTSENLRPGENTIEIVNPRGSEICYYLQSLFTVLNPPSHPRAPIEISLSLARTELSIGDNVGVSVSAVNKEDIPSGMVTAQMGIPSGLLPNYKQLKEHVKADIISNYEVENNILTIYWTGFTPNQTVTFMLNFIAYLPGEFASTPCRIYPYYAPEFVYWVEPLSVKIKENL